MVRYLEVVELPGTVCAEQNRPTRLGGIGGVDQQIKDHLLHLALVQRQRVGGEAVILSSQPHGMLAEGDSGKLGAFRKEPAAVDWFQVK